MRVILVLLLALSLAVPAFAVKVTLTLTQEEIDAFLESTGSVSIESYVKSQANAQLNTDMDKRWEKKSLAEKKVLIP